MSNNEDTKQEEGEEMFKYVLSMFLFGGLLGGGLIGGCGGDEASQGPAGAQGEGSGSTILDCAAACAKIDECERADSACQQSCASFAALLSDSAARSIMDCITQSSCDWNENSVDFYDLEDYCFPDDCSGSTTALIDAARSAETRCGCDEASPEECTVLDDNLRPRWIPSKTCFNEAAINNLVNCLTSTTCSSLDTCGDTYSWRGTDHESDK